MADYLNSQFLVNFVRETPAENYKLMNMSKKQIASSFENGEKNLQVGDVDVPIIDQSTNIYLISEKPVTITLSNGTIFEDTEQFAYSGKDKISVTISNKGSTVVRVVYAAGTIINK